MKRKRASSYSRRRRGARLKKKQTAHKSSLLHNMISNLMRPSEYFAGIKVLKR
jgi:hypothetical protein